MASKSVATKIIASKAKAATPKGKDGETPEPETPDTPLPLLDLSDAAVKKMIKQAKKRGYVTYEQLNAVMPSEEVTSEKIEDVLAMMNEMGINVVETEEAEAAGEIRSQGTVRADRRSGTHVPSGNGLGGAALARGRNRHRQAHRGRPRGDDRRAVREPAVVPGRHHLARRAQRGQGFPARHHR